jgi:hypothetical protein
MVAGMNEHARTRQGIPFAPDRDAYTRANRDSLVRSLTAQVLTSLRGRGRAAEVIEEAWPSDHLAQLLLRSATSPTSTTSFPQAAGLAGMVLLAPQSAALRLFQTQTILSIGEFSTIRIPGIGTPPTAPFVGEMAPAPLVQGVLNTATLGPLRKIMLLAGVTEEMEQANPTNASTIIGNVLASTVAKSLDQVAFDANPDNGVRPAGLLFGVTPVGAAASIGAGGEIGAIATDLGNLVAAMVGANIDPENFQIIAAPRQALKLRLLAGPKFDNQVFGSVGVAAGTVIGVARGGIASCFEGAPTIETAKGATLQYSDPAGAVIAGGPTTSLYQQAQVALRLRQRATWVVTTPGAVQVVDSVNW